MQHSSRVRSLLFVPASRPDRFSKALATNADRVILDLEDSVLPSEKAKARHDIREYLESNPKVRVLVRINSVGTSDFREDLELCGSVPGITGIVMPKAEKGSEIGFAAEAGKGVWPLIETASGLLNLSDICRAPSVERLTFGAVDLCANLRLKSGSNGAREFFNEVRMQLVLHASAHGLNAPIDTVTTEVKDLSEVRRNASYASGMGMGGMLCIHPSQVPIANEVFMPSQEEIAWAQRIMEHAGRAGVFKLDGEMIDAPVIDRAKSILDQINS
ncbi:CoA ester lyase [Marinobacter sp. B9-2]|nr:CoA ester lyase [Marinobacter sp. B9-2]